MFRNPLFILSDKHQASFELSGKIQPYGKIPPFSQQTACWSFGLETSQSGVSNAAT